MDFFDLVTEVIDPQVVLEPVVLDRPRDPVVDAVALGGRHPSTTWFNVPGAATRKPRPTCAFWPRSTPVASSIFAELSGTAMVASSAFVLTSLILLGWGYRVDFAQALVLLVLPLVLVAGLTVRTARVLQDSGFEHLFVRLRNHRFAVQADGHLLHLPEPPSGACMSTCAAAGSCRGF